MEVVQTAIELNNKLEIRPENEISPKRRNYSYLLPQICKRVVRFNEVEISLTIESTNNEQPITHKGYTHCIATVLH